MIKVYSMSVKPLYDESTCKAACDKLDTGRLEKVNQAKRTEDKVLRVGAGLLLQYAVKLSPVFDCTDDTVLCTQVSMEEVLKGIREPIEFDFCYGPHGKPYFKQHSDLFFSLSHSGEYVLCALSDAEIGADIQIIPEDAPVKRKREEHIAERFFTQPEKIWCQQSNAKEHRRRFYRLWSAKEAYVKMTGNGLMQGLGGFSIDLEKKVVADGEGSRMRAAIYEVKAPKGYTAVVCVKV